MRAWVSFTSARAHSASSWRATASSRRFWICFEAASNFCSSSSFCTGAQEGGSGVGWAPEAATNARTSRVCMVAECRRRNRRGSSGKRGYVSDVARRRNVQARVLRPGSHEHGLAKDGADSWSYVRPRERMTLALYLSCLQWGMLGWKYDSTTARLSRTVARVLRASGAVP